MATPLYSSTAADSAADPFSKAGRGFTLALNSLMSGVESRFGIKPGGLVERKLGRIMEAVPAAAVEAWVASMNTLAADHPEWQSLVECLTVHETYFYREPELMEMTRRDILPHLEQIRQSGRRLRLWSAACSSGEEAYDLAFLTLKYLQSRQKAMWSEFGVRLTDGWSMSVLGTDISNQVLRTARDGVYSNIAMGSIRDMPPEWKEMLESVPPTDPRADRSEAFYAVRPWVRSYVNFSRFNLMDSRPPCEDIDLAFCRNVLIYFEDSVKRQVQTMLARAIAPGGVLVLGSAVRLLATEYFSSQFGAGGSWYIRNDVKVTA
ncbi:MAG: hypothetical protein NBV65_12130 [Burkholderiaceae bacterium]|nr:hypothetical protein [Burkholderiaceae bacterium]